MQTPTVSIETEYLATVEAPLEPLQSAGFRAIVNGNGSTWIAERVFPPGIAAHAAWCCARLFGLRAR